MKFIPVAVLFALFVAPAQADTIQNLSGQLFLPGESLTYNFQIQTLIKPEFGGFVEDIFNGTALIFANHGQLVSTENFSNDVFEFGLNETAIIFQFAIFTNTGDPFTPPVLVEGYNFIGSAKGVSIEFVPEPGIVLFALVGMPLCCLLSNKRRPRA